ncbi:MAG: ATP-binding protein [Gemmataceae bacterium]|nr:ATP-binding protein [Gemmataceae bacterium]
MTPSPDPVTADVTIPSDLGEAHALQARIEDALQAFGYGDRDVFAIRLALEEALVNAIKHGNQLDPDKRVHVRYTVAPDRFDVRIADEGPGFDPAAVPDPTEDDFIERPCGRGLLLIRGFMSSVEYHGCGNVVTMSKLRNGHPAGG